MTQMYIQKSIILPLVEDLLAGGFFISVNTNDAWTTEIEKSRDRDAIMAAIFNPEIDSADYCLDCFASADAEGSEGMVRLIDGNGVDVISDNSVCLEQYMKRATILAEKIDGGETEWMEAQLKQRDALLAAVRAIIFQVSQGAVLDRDACITQAREAYALSEG